MVATFVPLALLADRLPHWLSLVVFPAYFVLVLAPVAFGVGPIGRRLGRVLNESMVARARAEREALGPTRATTDTRSTGTEA